jgi:hypothetical protein
MLLVLAAEMRRVLVTNPEAGAGGVEFLARESTNYAELIVDDYGAQGEWWTAQNGKQAQVRRSSPKRCSQRKQPKTVFGRQILNLVGSRAFCRRGLHARRRTKTPT